MKRKRSRPKFNCKSELIALGVQCEGSRDIVFPIDRFYGHKIESWVYECELVSHLDGHLKRLGDSLPHPPDSIVYVEEKNLTTLNIEDEF